MRIDDEDDDFETTLAGLPPAVKAKTERLDDAREATYAALSAASATVERAKDSLAEAKRDLQDLERYAEKNLIANEKKSFDKSGNETVVVTPDPGRLEAARERVRTASDKLDRARQRNRELSGAWTICAGLHRRVEGYLAQVRSEPVRLHDVGARAETRNGEDLSDAVERIRGEIAALESAAKEARRAPIPKDEAKRIARLQIEELARVGIPSVTQLVNRGGKIGFPTEQIHGASVNSSITRGVDALALVAWLGKDALLKKIETEIDENAVDGAMSAEEKKFSLMRIADDTLRLEREEESLIEQGEAKGVEIARRRTADPRAVLGLSSAMPQYKD